MIRSKKWMTTTYLLASMVVPQAAAENSVIDSTFTDSTLTEIQNSLRSGIELKMTERDRTQAKQWGLKETDWLKYKKIMSGPRGVWSPGLDPLTVLGVSETDAHERQRYADIWIEIESKRYELEIAFEVERQKAAKRRFGNQKAINNASWVANWNKANNSYQKQIILFVDVKCTEECKEYVESVRQSVGRQNKLDIFFKEGASAENIGQWATFMKLSQEDVRSRKITLNFDDGTSGTLNVKMTELPKRVVVDLKTGEIVDRDDG